MPKAKKLPSGSWRCQVYVGDVVVNGKRRPRMESVTVKDPSDRGRIRCEALALDLEAQARRLASSDLTVAEALDHFIESRRRSGLSVSTISAYISLRRNAFVSIEHLPVRKLTDRIAQDWMDSYRLTHSPKSCKNAFGLLSSAVKFALPSSALAVRLPERAAREYYTPTDDDVRRLLAAVSGDSDLYKAVLLSAYGTFRRGEICALTYADIVGNEISVTKDMIWDRSSASWVLGPCKNPQSRRTVIFPAAVVSLLLQGDHDPDDRVVAIDPGMLSVRFRRARRAAMLPEFRFHDLRAYSASVRHALGIPDQYIMADGGWKTDAVLKRIYRRAMEDKRREFAAVSAAHFEKLLQDDFV